jgi:hypothetical protein
LFGNGALEGFGTLVTDGTFYAASTQINAGTSQSRTQTFAGLLPFGEPVLLFDEPSSAGSDGAVSLADPDLALDNGRLAFEDSSRGESILRVVNLGTSSDVFVAELGYGTFLVPHQIALGDSLVAYPAASGESSADLVVFDFETGETTTLASGISRGEVAVFVTDGGVVWSEARSGGTIDVFAYDAATGEMGVWVSGATGSLAGASDGFFVTQEDVYREDRRDRIIIREYDVDGEEKTLAEFDRRGFSGQARVVGEFTVWVNPSRRIIMAPLGGGGRLSFRPY